MFSILTYPIRHPSSLLFWPGQRRRRITPIGVYLALCCAFSYRPGHPWAGIEGGLYGLFLIFAILYGVTMRRAYVAACAQLKESR
jgi:hypothetical protein